MLNLRKLTKVNLVLFSALYPCLERKFKIIELSSVRDHGCDLDVIFDDNQ